MAETSVPYKYYCIVHSPCVCVIYKVGKGHRVCVMDRFQKSAMRRDDREGENNTVYKKRRKKN